jgi:hypothetical protein
MTHQYYPVDDRGNEDKSGNHRRPLCPHCYKFGGIQIAVWRDSVDVGVGVIHGPWGCGNCGWSSDPEYDRRDGDSPAQIEHPDAFVDQYGGLTPRKRLQDKLNAVNALEDKHG